MNHVDRILKHVKRAKTRLLLCCIGSFVLAALIIGSPKTGTSESPLLPNNLPLQNPSGLHATFSTSGSIDLRNEFFQNLGTWPQLRDLPPGRGGLDHHSCGSARTI
jgi:hypothetical protein